MVEENLNEVCVCGHKKSEHAEYIDNTLASTSYVPERRQCLHPEIKGGVSCYDCSCPYFRPAEEKSVVKENDTTVSSLHALLKWIGENDVKVALSRTGPDTRLVDADEVTGKLQDILSGFSMGTNELKRWQELTMLLPHNFEECNSPPWTQIEDYIRGLKELCEANQGVIEKLESWKGVLNQVPRSFEEEGRPPWCQVTDYIHHLEEQVKKLKKVNEYLAKQDAAANATVAKHKLHPIGDEYSANTVARYVASLERVLDDTRKEVADLLREEKGSVRRTSEADAMLLSELEQLHCIDKTARVVYEQLEQHAKSGKVLRTPKGVGHDAWEQFGIALFDGEGKKLDCGCRGECKGHQPEGPPAFEENQDEDWDRKKIDGKEAEELRSGIEKVIRDWTCEVPEALDVLSELQKLLDNVDARDSLHYLAKKANKQVDQDSPQKPVASLSAELQRVLNCYSAENGSDTPDFILAKYVLGALAVFDAATNDRTKWYGKEPMERGPRMPDNITGDLYAPCATCGKRIATGHSVHWNGKRFCQGTDCYDKYRAAEKEPSPQKPEHKLIQKALSAARVIRRYHPGHAIREETLKGFLEAAEEYEADLKKQEEKSCETCGKPKDKPDDELAPCGLPCTGFDLWEAKKPDIPLTSAVVFRVYANHGVCDSYEPNDMVIKGWLEHSEESTARNPNADKPIQWRESATDFVTDMKEVIPEHKLWAVEDELKRVAPRPSDFVNELELFREAVDRVRIVALGAANLLKDRKDPYDQGRQATWVQIEQNLKAVLAGHRPHVPKCGACSIEADIGTEEVPHPVDARLHACMDFEKQADTPSMTSECQECGRLYAHSLNGRLPNCPDCNAYHWRRPPLGIRQNHVPEKKESTFIEGSVAEAHRDSQMTRNVHRKNCLDGEHEPDEGFGFFQQRVWVDLEQKESFMRTVRRCKHCGCLYVEES